MSIADCLKKHGIDAKHEDVILKGFAQAVDDGQLDDHVEATGALQEALIDAENERADIMAQIAPKTDNKGKLLNTNFTKWFGDSVVIDEQGRALVVYHGTSQDISVFNPDKVKGKTFGTGSFFSSNPLTSATYTKGANGGNIMPVYLSMRTPAVLDAQGANWNRINKNTRVELPAIDGKKSRNTTLGRLLPDDFKYVDDYGSTDDIARWARQQGYDGLIINNVKDQGPTGNFVTEESGAPGTIYVVYKANQVKSAIGNKGQFSKSNDDIRFSKSEVEHTLIAQHNLSVSNLIHADRMGALAAPSIAITDKAHPLTGFGEITLLADEDFVNGARTFGADIYSTRYPTIRYKFTVKDADKLNEMFKGEKDRIGDTSQFYPDSFGYDPHQTLKEIPAVAMKFLEAEGIKPKIKYVKARTKPDAIFNKWVKSSLDKYGLSNDDAFIADVKVQYKEQFKDVDKLIPSTDEAWRNVARNRADDIVRYRESVRDKGKLDLDATRNSMVEQIRLHKKMDKFEGYITSVINEINPKQRISDKNGNKQIEHTLDNVIRNMRSSFVGGENFGFGLGKIRSAHAPEFKSIAQIRKNKQRLMTSEAFGAVRDEVAKELNELSSRVNEYGTYSGWDNLEAAIFDSAKMGISRALTYNGFKNVPDDVKLEIEQFISKLRNMPTEYFEAKVLRGVGIGEFKAAVVPKDIAPEALAILKKNGITDIRMYKPGNSEDRFKQINSVKHVMFSRSDVEYLDAVNAGDMEKAQRMVDDKLESVGAYWHGTPSGDLRGGMTGLHVGTKQAAIEALEARIGIPADGKGWDGTREYGKTLLAGRDRVASGQFGEYRLTGFNSDAPKNDFYPDANRPARMGNGDPMLGDWKPWVRPVMIVGKMAKRKKTDSAANSSMGRLLAKGAATEGFYYENIGEDAGSISAALPNGDHVKIKLPDAVTYDDDGNVIPLSKRFDKTNNDIRFSRAPKLYSKLEQALESANDKVFSTGPQVKMWLQSNAGKLGIKKDEIYWSGIDNWLDAQGKVNKQQVVEFVQNNGVQVEDVTLGGDQEFNDIRDKLDRMLLAELEDRPVDKEEQKLLEKRLREIKNTEPKHNNDKLTLPGGTDYKELVVTVPTIEPHNADDHTHFGNVGIPSASDMQAYENAISAIHNEVDTNFAGILIRMKNLGVLEVNCD